MAETPKKLSQTRLSSYFSGCTKEPLNEMPSRKKTPKSNRALSQSMSYVNSFLTLEYSALISNIPKRKLPVPIISDDSDDDYESPTKRKKGTYDEKHITNNIPQIQRSPRKYRKFKGKSENISVFTNNVPNKTDVAPIEADISPVKVLQNVIISPPVKSEATGLKDSKNAINYEQVKVMRKFFENVLKQDHFLKLFQDSEKQLLRNFFNMEQNHQYLCIKLFLWKPIWYNIFQYAEKIKLCLDEKAVLKIYEDLKNNNFIKTDYMSESCSTLLHILTAKDVKELTRIFKIKSKDNTKEALIEKLLNICETQRSVSTQSSMEHVLKKRIKERLGFCIQLSDDCRRCLFDLYLLNTFTNSALRDPQDYFTNVSYFNMIFPQYQVERFSIFNTPTEFARYADAVKLRCDLEVAVTKKRTSDIYDICKRAYTLLKETNDELGSSFDSSKQFYLERFTPNAQYCYILCTASNGLTKRCYDEVATWFEYLVSQGFCKHKRGDWFAHLALIYTYYMKQYEKAAKLLIQVFKDEMENFTDVQIQGLVHRTKMLYSKRNNLPKLFHDELVAVSPHPCDLMWSEDVIQRKSTRSNEPGRRRLYAHRRTNGDVEYLTVEDTALQHYKENGFPNGVHCEGSIITSLFCLLFWDIIYETYVEGTFVSSVQDRPLDMCTKYFYENRQNLIDLRLDDLEKNWDEAQIREKIFDNWERHSRTTTLSNLGDVSPETLFDVLICIGRPILRKILSRVVKNFRVYHSGCPDLVVWNNEEKRVKFVEVKSENDVLSIKQKLWLSYLLEVEASVAVCHVAEPNKVKKKKKVGRAAT